MVAEVISVKAHPKADRLRVCSVDYGHDVAQVVTNAANIAEGMKVVFAVCTLRHVETFCRTSAFAMSCLAP